MTQSIWLHLFQKYVGTDKRILPGADGEPWVSYEIVAELLTMESETISRLATKHKIQRHPVFTGLVKISSFERVAE